MLAQLRNRSLVARVGTILAAISLISVTSACDKVPLTAPGGTVITLFPTANTVPLNGEIEIVATAIENGTTSTTTPTTPTNGNTTTTPTTPTTPTSTSSTGAGTPVQNGTLITFTTTMGRIEPSEARTSNGQVRVRLIAGAQSGIATVTAFSGGASGKIENLRIGSAAVERVLLTATPQTLGASGGTSVITARVEDVNGAGVSGVPVAFTADVGSLSAGTANTDASGIASVTLITTAKATVTANVAGKTATVAVALNPRTGITITPPTGNLTALTPATFTIGVSATANIQSVRVNWGDGRTDNLGALSASTPVTHTYQEEGQYTVTATATDTSGFNEPVSTTVNVLPAQPPTVIVTATPTTASVNQLVTLRAQVSGNTATIIRYEWSFGSDAATPTIVTSSAQVQNSWRTPGTKGISVTVFQSSGPTGDGFGSVNITSGTGATAVKK
jgi:hypothetical protein